MTCIEPGVFQRISPLNAIVFAETSGWYVTPTEGGTSGIAVDVSDSSAVITYLDTNYRARYWYRN